MSDDEDEHEQHCFHGHALLFEESQSIEVEAATYYSNQERFNDLAPALSYAATTRHYFLVSPSPDQFVIFSEPLNAPRQLARTLVAFKQGTPELADWRSHPRVEEAMLMASELRIELGAQL